MGKDCMFECMKAVILWMICFNDSKTFSGGFRNTKFHFKSSWL